jgi:hypothetical protein
MLDFLAEYGSINPASCGYGSHFVLRFLRPL